MIKINNYRKMKNNCSDGKLPQWDEKQLHRQNQRDKIQTYKTIRRRDDNSHTLRQLDDVDTLLVAILCLSLSVVTKGGAVVS